MWEIHSFIDSMMLDNSLPTFLLLLSFLFFSRPPPPPHSFPCSLFCSSNIHWTHELARHSVVSTDKTQP